MLLTQIQLPLEAISRFHPYSLHPWDLQELPPELEDSFTRVGILNPPLVRKDDNGGYTIVSGTRRIQFLRAIHKDTTVHCRLLARDCPQEILLEMILTEQLLSESSLSLGEKASFLHIARELHPTAEIEGYKKRLGLKNLRRFSRLLKPLYTHGGPFLKEMHKGLLGETAVAEIFQLKRHQDRLAFVELVTGLGIGEGKQRRLLELLRDVALKTGQDIQTLLKKEQFSNLFGKDIKNQPQHYQKLLVMLSHWLHPASTEAEQAFKKEIDSMNLPSGYSLSPSQAFEKDEVTLSIVFADLQQCKKYLADES